MSYPARAEGLVNRMIFIIKVFRIIVFIFIVISTTFQLICPPAFFRCMSNSGTFTELRTTSFIESTGLACSDSVSHNQVKELSIPVLLLACSQDRTCNLLMIVSSETWGSNAYNRYAIRPKTLNDKILADSVISDTNGFIYLSSAPWLHEERERDTHKS